MRLLRTIATAALAAGPMLGTILGAALWVPHAAAQAPPAPGTVITGTLPLYGKPVPLPPGPWRVAAAGFGQIRQNAPADPFGAIANVLLERPAQTAGDEKLLVQTNALPVGGGWGPPLECADENALFRHAAEPHDLLQACAFVLALADARQLQAALPGLPAGTLPWPALLAGVRVSDRRDMLEIRYALSAHGPDREAALRRLEGWTQPAAASAMAALRQPPGWRPSLPDPSGPDPSGPNLSAADPSGPVGGHPAAAEVIAPSPGLPLGALATYTVASSLASAGIASAMTGSLYTGMLVAVVQGLTQTALYFGNEMAFDWQRAAPPMPVGPVLAAPMTAAVNLSVPAVAPAPLVIDGKGVPLPGDGWQVLARTEDPGITGTALARLRNGRLAGLILVHTTPAPRSVIAGMSSLCRRAGDGFAMIRYDTRVDGFCAFGRLSAEPAQDRLWDAAVEALITRQIAIPDGYGPDGFAMVGAQARTREHVLDLLVYLPAADVESSAALATWADLLQDPMERGVRGRLSATEAALPWPGDEQTALEALAARPVRTLKALRAQGAIGQATLERQTRAVATSLAGEERSQWSLATSSFVKDATFQTLSMIDAFGVYWVLANSASGGLVYSSITSLMQPVLAYGAGLYAPASGAAGPTLAPAP